MPALASSRRCCTVDDCLAITFLALPANATTWAETLTGSSDTFAVDTADLRAHTQPRDEKHAIDLTRVRELQHPSAMTIQADSSTMTTPRPTDPIAQRTIPSDEIHSLRCRIEMPSWTSRDAASRCQARRLDAVDHGVQLSNNAPRVADAPATLEHHCRLAAREEFSYRRARVVGFAEDDIAGIWPPVRDQQSEIMSAVFIHLTGIGLTPCNAQRVACDLERRQRP